MSMRLLVQGAVAAILLAAAFATVGFGNSGAQLVSEVGSEAADVGTPSLPTTGVGALVTTVDTSGTAALRPAEGSGSPAAVIAGPGVTGPRFDASVTAVLPRSQAINAHPTPVVIAGVGVIGPKVDSPQIVARPGSDTLIALARAGVGVIGPEVNSPQIVARPGSDTLTALARAGVADA